MIHQALDKDFERARPTIVNTKINPPPPKPPDKTYQNIAGAYGRARDETPWQTAPDSIDTRAETGMNQFHPEAGATGEEGTQPPGGQGRPESENNKVPPDDVDLSIAAMGQEMRQMGAYQSELQRENSQIRAKNDQLGLELKQIMDQFQKLQLELDESRSRMAIMRKENESEIIRANRAYTKSLEQMQGKAGDSGYYPQSHRASALPASNPTTIQPGATAIIQDTAIDRSIPQQLGEPTHDTPHESSNHEFPQSFPSYEPPQPQPQQNQNELPHNHNQPPNNQNGNDLTTIFRMMMTTKSPSMNIPPFDGTYEDFDDWYQEFHAKIHTNILLTKYEKILILEKETCGQAKTIVTTCGRQENSYELAITKLKDTYQGHDSKLQKLYARIKQTTPLTHENQSRYTRFADDVQIFVNHLIQQHNEKLISDGPRYCDEILYRLPKEEIVEMEERKRKCLETHSDVLTAYAQFLGVLVTHTQKIAADHRQRLKITRSLGIARDHSLGQHSKQSFLSDRSNSKPEHDQGLSESGQHQTGRESESYSSSNSHMSSTDSDSEPNESTRTALLATRKDHKPSNRRSTSRKTGRSTSVNDDRKRSRTGTPQPRRKERHPRGLSAERETQQQSKNDRNKTANKRRYYPGVNVTRLTAQEIEAQRPIISPAKPEHPTKGV